MNVLSMYIHHYLSSPGRVQNGVPFTATSTPVVTSVTGPENLGAVLRRKVHGNLVSWNRGILYNECSNVLALVGKWICVLSLNIALL